MALKTTVKVNQITNLHDARYCAGMGVDFIGFSIDAASVSFVSAKKYNEIISWLTGVKFVVELPTLEKVNMAEILNDYPADALQTSHLQDLPALQQTGLPIIVELPIAQINGEILAQIKPYTTFLLLTSSEKIISPEQKKLIANLAPAYKILLGFGIDSENINELIDELALAGVALNPSIEIQTGINDFDEIAAVLEQIEVD
jgi:phosphoribosylanthranilate isomerase